MVQELYDHNFNPIEQLQQFVEKECDVILQMNDSQLIKIIESLNDKKTIQENLVELSQMKKADQ